MDKIIMCNFLNYNIPMDKIACHQRLPDQIILIAEKGIVTLDGVAYSIENISKRIMFLSILKTTRYDCFSGKYYTTKGERPNA